MKILFINGTHHSTWISDGDTCWSAEHEIDVETDYFNNIITLIADKNWFELRSVDETDRFCFYTRYYSENNKNPMVHDITDNSLGSGIIVGPVGDVPFGFIDIIQGSISIY